MPGLHEEGDRVQWCGDGDGTPAAGVRFEGEVIIIGGRGGQVDIHRVGALGDDGFDQEARVGEVELVVEGEPGFVFGVDVIVRSHDGEAGCGRRVECRVPRWQQLVPESERLGDDLRVRVAN